MPAKVKAPAAGFTLYPPLGPLPGPITETFINGVSIPSWFFPTVAGHLKPGMKPLGAAPRGTISQVTPSATRQGSMKMGGALVQQSQKPRQDPNVNKPQVSTDSLLADLLKRQDLPVPLKRLLQTIPEETTLHMISHSGQVRGAEIADYYERAAAATNNYAVTPGIPTWEDLDSAYEEIAEDYVPTSDIELQEATGEEIDMGIVPEPAEDVFFPTYQAPDFDYSWSETAGDFASPYEGGGEE